MKQLPLHSMLRDVCIPPHSQWVTGSVSDSRRLCSYSLQCRYAMYISPDCWNALSSHHLQLSDWLMPIIIFTQLIYSFHCKLHTQCLLFMPCTSLGFWLVLPIGSTKSQAESSSLSVCWRPFNGTSSAVTLPYTAYEFVASFILVVTSVFLAVHCSDTFLCRPLLSFLVAHCQLWNALCSLQL